MEKFQKVFELLSSDDVSEEKTNEMVELLEAINKPSLNMDYLGRAESAYYYAKDVIRGRFPEGEAVIAKDVFYAYNYALCVLKDRFPEGETIIAKDVRLAYHYAMNVIKGRFPEGEAVIAQSAEWACKYARDVIKGRFPEAEITLTKDKYWAYRYVLNTVEMHPVFRKILFAEKAG